LIQGPITQVEYHAARAVDHVQLYDCKQFLAHKLRANSALFKIEKVWAISRNFPDISRKFSLDYGEEWGGGKKGMEEEYSR
jgi:hypothetical protein